MMCYSLLTLEVLDMTVNDMLGRYANVELRMQAALNVQLFYIFCGTAVFAA